MIQWFDFVEEFWSLYDGSSDGCKRGSWHSLIIHTLQSFKTQGIDTCRKRKEKMKKPVHIGNWVPDETGWTTNHNQSQPITGFGMGALIKNLSLKAQPDMTFWTLTVMDAVECSCKGHTQD